MSLVDKWSGYTLHEWRYEKLDVISNGRLR
jgi:hypothetical protein